MRVCSLQAFGDHRLLPTYACLHKELHTIRSHLLKPFCPTVHNMAEAEEGENIVIQERLVIQGGALGKDAWIPRSLVTICDAPYVELSRADRKLHRFIGFSSYNTTPLVSNKFIDSLYDKRNDAVDDAIFAMMLERDPLIDIEAKAKLVKAYRRVVDTADLPPFVEVDLPEISHTNSQGITMHVAAIKMKIATQLNRVRNVVVELIPQNLHYIRVACWKAAEEHPSQDAKKRAQPMVSVEGIKGVMCDKRRKVVFMRWAQPGSSEPPKRILRKPLVWQQPFINQCARALYEEVAATGCEGIVPNPLDADGEQDDHLEGEHAQEGKASQHVEELGEAELHEDATGESKPMGMSGRCC